MAPNMKVLLYHLQVRMNEAEVMYFHTKLQDAARERGANSEHGGNVFVFMWAYKIKCTCFNIFVVLPYQQNHRKKLNLTKMLLEKL